jgi:hypothetical protein
LRRKVNGVGFDDMLCHMLFWLVIVLWFQEWTCFGCCGGCCDNRSHSTNHCEFDGHMEPITPIDAKSVTIIDKWWLLIDSFEAGYVVNEENLEAHRHVAPASFAVNLEGALTKNRLNK